jgi:hypothetical protein
VSIYVSTVDVLVAGAGRVGLVGLAGLAGREVDDGLWRTLEHLWATDLVQVMVDVDVVDSMTVCRVGMKYDCDTVDTTVVVCVTVSLAGKINDMVIICRSDSNSVP